MPNIMERSVIDMRQGSYVITLPKPWIRYMRIKPKDILEVIINDDLIIRKKKTQRIKNRRPK
jgi:bifunctional DNA-binding transcriptional regulator/antitoxin component of YhaV-PrlF toxin-antitoxin module